MHPSRLSSLSPRALACALSCTLACALLPAGGLALLPVSAALAAGPAASGPPPAADPAQLERRLQSVATLIDASSAARQIEASGVAAARAHRDNARLIHREAADALKAGDLTATLRLLDQATREMMDGARQARPEQVTGAKSQRDFDARLESTRALLAAQQRITGEKAASAPAGSAQAGTARDAAQATRAIERQLTEAQSLAAQGQLDAARQVLDRAYLTTRVSIESLRRGDTLVRSLHFATPKDEYDYELDRNDTHALLVKVVLADRPGAAASAPMPAAMQGFVDQSRALRQQAEAAAAAGRHAEGVKLLEAATRELVRAIRAGGLYIPG